MEKKLSVAEIKQIVKGSPGNLFSRKVDENDVGENCCSYCAKKLGKKPRFVHITTDGNIVRNDITEEQLKKAGLESQGCFPIGSECIKKLLGDKVEEYSIKDFA